MSSASRRLRLRVLARVLIDALTYAVFLTAVTVVAALVFAVLTGGGLVRAKHALFIVGWGMLAYATVQMWIRSGKQLRASSKPAQRESNASEQPPDSMATASEVRNRLTSTPDHSDGTSLRERQDTTRFQALVQTLPPNRWVRNPAPERRLTIAAKLLLTSVFVLAVSFVMEAVFGVV